MEMPTNPSEYLKNAVFLGEQEAPQRRALKIYTQSTSHGEVLQKALLFFEELVDGDKKNELFLVRSKARQWTELYPSLFFDRQKPVQELTPVTINFSLQAEERIAKTQEYLGVEDPSIIIRAAYRLLAKLAIEHFQDSDFFVLGDNICSKVSMEKANFLDPQTTLVKPSIINDLMPYSMDQESSLQRLQCFLLKRAIRYLESLSK